MRDFDAMLESGVVGSDWPDPTTGGRPDDPAIYLDSPLEVVDERMRGRGESVRIEYAVKMKDETTEWRNADEIPAELLQSWRKKQMDAQERMVGTTRRGRVLSRPRSLAGDFVL